MRCKKRCLNVNFLKHILLVSHLPTPSSPTTLLLRTYLPLLQLRPSDPRVRPLVQLPIDPASAPLYVLYLFYNMLYISFLLSLPLFGTAYTLLLHARVGPFANSACTRTRIRMPRRMHRRTRPDARTISQTQSSFVNRTASTRRGPASHARTSILTTYGARLVYPYTLCAY